MGAAVPVVGALLSNLLVAGDQQQPWAQLGDYRDSKELVNTTLPYARAAFLMTSAENADASALSQHPDYANVAETPEDPTVMLYEGAAKLFMAMGDVEDCVAQASQCYSRIATIYMEQGLFEEALGCMKYLTEADAQVALSLWACLLHSLTGLIVH